VRRLNCDEVMHIQTMADLGGAGGAAAPPLASFRKIQGLPISKIVSQCSGTAALLLSMFTVHRICHNLFPGLVIFQVHETVKELSVRLLLSLIVRQSVIAF